MIENKEIEILSNDPFKVDNVLEDFGCSLSEENSKKGRLYLNDRCIGFSSEDKERDVFLNFNEIKQIILSGENIEIETHKENKILFFLLMTLILLLTKLILFSNYIMKMN